MSKHSSVFYRAAKFGPSKSPDWVGICARWGVCGPAGMLTLALEDVKVKIPGLQLACAAVTLTVNRYGEESPASLRIAYFT